MKSPMCVHERTVTMRAPICSTALHLELPSALLDKGESGVVRTTVRTGSVTVSWRSGEHGPTFSRAGPRRQRDRLHRGGREDRCRHESIEAAGHRSAAIGGSVPTEDVETASTQRVLEVSHQS